MRLKIQIFAFGLLLFSQKSMGAGIIEIQNRPLRTLGFGSELYLLIEGDLRVGMTYQDGHTVLMGYPPFDKTKPWCEVSQTSSLPPLDEYKIPLRLQTIEGSVYDSPALGYEPIFRTKMWFMGKGAADLDIVCSSPSTNLYRETTIAEMEQVFGLHLRFGALSLGDMGMELRNPLYGEYDVLTPLVLRKFILLKTKSALRLKRDSETPLFYELKIAGGAAQKETPLDQSYCSLMFNNESSLALEEEFEIPAQTEMRFSGFVSGGYTKEKDFSNGFILHGELSGFKYPLSLYCSSNDPNKPLRYTDARRTTGALLDWIYSF